MGMCLYRMTSLQCVEAFSPSQLGEEQNCEGQGPQSEQYLHSWGEVIIDGIRARPLLKVWASYARMCVPVRGVDCSDPKSGVLHSMESHIV